MEASENVKKYLRLLKKREKAGKEEKSTDEELKIQTRMDKVWEKFNKEDLDQYKKIKRIEFYWETKNLLEEFSQHLTILYNQEVVGVSGEAVDTQIIVKDFGDIEVSFVPTILYDKAESLTFNYVELLSCENKHDYAKKLVEEWKNDSERHNPQAKS